jgi:hypothetical protein
MEMPRPPASTEQLDRPAGTALSSLVFPAAKSSASLSERTSPEYTSAAMPAAETVDVVLEDYFLQRPLPAAAKYSPEDTSLDAADHVLVSSSRDELQDFIRLGGLSAQDGDQSWEEIVANERDGVERIVNGLHDLRTSWRERTVNRFDSPQVESDRFPGARAGFPTALDREHSGAADEALDAGMVLLPAAGDANECECDLANVSDASPVLLIGHLGTEASIGIYQAFDTAIEELLPDDSHRPELPAPPLPQKEIGDGPPLERARPAGKPAVAIGAATLLGATLWYGRKARRARFRDSERYATGAPR